MTDTMSRPGPERQHGSGDPSVWVSRFLPLVRGGGRLLDLACGGGRHARLAAGLGLQVTALDRNREALASLEGIMGIATFPFDLEAGEAVWPFPAGAFDGIVVTNYLHRPLFPDILAALAPGGVLIYETFAIGNEAFGKPSNPDFLLQTGELLEAFAALTVIAFEQGRTENPSPAVRQRICAVRNAEPKDLTIGWAQP